MPAQNHRFSPPPSEDGALARRVFVDDQAAVHAEPVAVSLAHVAFDALVLSVPGAPRTLYVGGKNGAERDTCVDGCGCWWTADIITGLLDLASEELGCGALVLVLERGGERLGEMLHSLMYVGGVVVTKPPYAVDKAYVLVGLEM